MVNSDMLKDVMSLNTIPLERLKTKEKLESFNPYEDSVVFFLIYILDIIVKGINFFLTKIPK
ncbi:MAG: hypothetical protein ACFE8G_02190 [Candidatus Hermodarchaeota archaeon]